MMLHLCGKGYRRCFKKDMVLNSDLKSNRRHWLNARSLDESQFRLYWQDVVPYAVLFPMAVVTSCPKTETIEACLSAHFVALEVP
jgi:hypothetical protein